ncbi:MAG: PsbP-related protein [Bacteroidota bacterium]
MEKKEKHPKSFTDFLKEISGIISGITAFAVTVDTLIRVSQEGFNSQLPIVLITGLILVAFLGCFYIAFLWKISKPTDIKYSSSLILPKSVQRESYRDGNKNKKKIKKIAYLGVILIPLLLFIDLLGWSLIQRSYLWKNLYVIQLNSQDTPELIKECINSKHGVEIRYPESWGCRQAVNPFDQSILVLNPKPGETKNIQDTKIVVQVYPMSAIESLDAFLAEHLLILKQKRLNDFQLIAKDEITFIEQRGYKIEYQASESERLIRYKELLALKNKQAYIVTYLADKSNFMKNEKVAERIVTTLELLES